MQKPWVLVLLSEYKGLLKYACEEKEKEQLK